MWTNRVAIHTKHVTNLLSLAIVFFIDLGSLVTIFQICVYVFLPKNKNLFSMLSTVHPCSFIFLTSALLTSILHLFSFRLSFVQFSSTTFLIFFNFFNLYLHLDIRFEMTTHFIYFSNVNILYTFEIGDWKYSKCSSLIRRIKNSKWSISSSSGG